MRTADLSKRFKNGHKAFGRAKPPRVTVVTAGGLEGRMRRSLADAMREYLQTCTLQGVKYATHADTIKSLRHVYIFLMIVLFVCGLAVLAYFSYGYQHSPKLRMNTLHTAPESPVAFPAVAICSNNVVSKMELEKYALYLHSEEQIRNHRNRTHYNLAKIKENLEKFGFLVTLRTSDVEMLNFMQFLYNIIPNFNITDLMYTLSPKCPSMLTFCRWRGRGIPCKNIFATRLTPLGFCCVFNGRYYPEDIDNDAKVLDLLGNSLGLTVGVYQNIDDFAVIRQPSTYALSVLLFDGADFPLLESGAVRAYNVATNASINFQLTANVEYATEDLKNNRDAKRHCHLKQFDGPRSGSSSYSWCLAECRRQSIIAICNCQPFWYHPARNQVVCSPEHLFCLNKHREKFIYYYPGNQNYDGGLDEEQQDSLDCENYNCLPDCARIMHTAKVFQPTYYYPKKLLRQSVSFVNISIIRIYYDAWTTKIHRMDLNSFWYEVVVNLSCQSMFLLGLSLFSVGELVFHLTIRWGHHLLRRTRVERLRTQQEAFY